MLQLWIITANHDKYTQQLRQIKLSHQRGLTAREKTRLRPLYTEEQVEHAKGQRVPKQYEEKGAEVGIQGPLTLALVWLRELHLAVPK